MHIWIDLGNSPHVPFFRALVPEFERRGHLVEMTARDFAQTVEMAEAAGFSPAVIGGHGGRRLPGKARNLASRAWALARWARTRHFDLAVSHNSHEHLLAARLRRLPCVTLMDYEYHPANHFSFRLATRVIVPRAFPNEALRRYGVREAKVRRYDGTKEDVYLADFEVDPKFAEELCSLGVGSKDVLIVVRPPALDALYHRFDNQLFDEMLERMTARADVKLIMLPRTEEQKQRLAERHRSANIIWPPKALDGSNLIAAADLVVSAGGTMNREAAALGVPTATIFAGRWAAIDEQLVNEGRLKRILTRKDLDALEIRKKCGLNARRARHVRAEVAELILSSTAN
jgi:predicted glycosyltransferase